ncbi:MAG: hypothetical protein ACE5D0_11020 [Fidelibacterota bacterium]
MKITSICFLLLFISCSQNQLKSGYPDCILQPDRQTDSYGCANIFVYQFLDSTRALTVTIDADELKLTEKCQTFSLENYFDVISVNLEISGGDPDSIYFNYCNDVVEPNMGTPDVYHGEIGLLTLSVSEDDPIKDPILETFYRVTIKIEDLHLFDQNSDEAMIINQVIFWDVGVGWLPG